MNDTSARSELKTNYKPHYIVVASAIAIVALLAIAPMLLRNYPIGHSTKFNLSWAFQYQQQFLGGQFYPRWLESSNFGFGNATFAFYPPICMVMTLPFRVLGFNLLGSLIASMWLAAVILGLGLYLYSRRFFPVWLSVVVSGLGMMSPYLAVDMYHRAAIAEVWGIVFIPWVLWATQRALDLPERRYPLLALIISYGLMALSHLPTLVIFTIVWVFYPWVMSDRTSPSASLGVNVRRCYSGAILAFGCTAFFLLPVLLDQSFVYIEFVTEDPEYRPQNRLIVDGVLSLHPKFSDHWFDPVLLPVWWSAIAAIALASGWWLYRVWRDRDRITESITSTSNQSDPAIDPILEAGFRFWLPSSILAILMMTDVLGWLYPLSHLLLERIQFSWRWFAITVVTVPLLCGYLLYKLQIAIAKGNWQPKLKQVAIVTVIALLSILQFRITNQLANRAWYDGAFLNKFEAAIMQKRFPIEPNTDGSSQPFFDWHRLYADGVALGDVPEYRTDISRSFPIPPPRNQPLVSVASGSVADVQILQWGYGFRRFAVNAPATAELLLRMLYYPAWFVQIDGKFVPLEVTQMGQLKVTVPAGKHLVEVSYLGTLSDWIGSGITVIALVITAIGWRRNFAFLALPKQVSRSFIPEAKVEEIDSSTRST
ncbi:hypothetical protein [Pseudanabaena sp. PCC 6802]|uniref:hypothetical protein n=1 Tax=Pseudanabaena sp. PCC 6802 TaxID=118173 RepID=UPI00034A8198|nr:hypothetical protein [Pseudanabaena sp. PCC 6802]